MFKHTGDGMGATFDRPIDAVAAAMALQRRPRRRSGPVAPHRHPRRACRATRRRLVRTDRQSLRPNHENLPWRPDPHLGRNRVAREIRAPRRGHRRPGRDRPACGTHPAGDRPPGERAGVAGRLPRPSGPAERQPADPTYLVRGPGSGDRRPVTNPVPRTDGHPHRNRRCGQDPTVDRMGPAVAATFPDGVVFVPWPRCTTRSTSPGPSRRLPASWRVTTTGPTAIEWRRSCAGSATGRPRSSWTTASTCWSRRATPST